MEVLLKDEEYVYFLIEYTEVCDVRVSFIVYEAQSWSDDDKKEPTKTAIYLSGHIKWDGCSHIWFTGETAHMCGKFYWELHNKLMTCLWDTVTKKIEGFDAEEAK